MIKIPFCCKHALETETKCETAVSTGTPTVKRMNMSEIAAQTASLNVHHITNQNNSQLTF